MNASRFEARGGRRVCVVADTVARLAHYSAILLLVLSTTLLVATPAQAAPQLWLPTPPGEAWRIIQGYGCGTHTGHDNYALDLVSDSGETLNAPVRAAADGVVWAWTASSGTIMLDHGGGFLTEYTHLSSHTVNRGDQVKRGDVIGTVGNTGAEWTVAHLHFTFYHDASSYNMGTSLPLSFAEGYDLPDVGGCNQHNGETFISANGMPDLAPPVISFTATPEAGHWYNSDQRIEFALSDDVNVAGFQQTWDRPANPEDPTFTGATSGYVQLDWAGQGMHELVVRAWDEAGNETTARVGPFGLDTTPPGIVSVPLHSAAATTEITATDTFTVSWQAASDGNGSGVAGYRLYYGSNAEGTSDWFEQRTSVEVQVQPGATYFRVQAIDIAGNASNWVTIAQFNRSFENGAE